MKNLKVRAKILVSFAIVLVLMVVLGVLSLLSIGTMGDTAADYANISIPATNNLLYARRTIRLFQADILESICVSTQADYDEKLANMETHREQYVDAVNEFFTYCPQFEDEKALLEQYLTDAGNVRSKVLAEAQKLNDEGNNAAFKVYQEEYIPALDKLTDELISLSDKLDEAIQNRVASTERVELIVIILVIAMLAVAAICVVIISIVVSASIVRPVKEIETAMEKVSEGKISEANVTYSSRDELGSLADSARTTIGFFNTVIPDIAYLCDEIGKGNFNVLSNDPNAYKGETESILTSMRHLRNNLSKTIEQVDVATQQVFSGAE